MKLLRTNNQQFYSEEEKGLHVNNSYARYFYIIILCLFFKSVCYAHMPRLTVVIVIDQFAYHYIPHLKPYFKHGLHELLDHGIVYTNAHHPHGAPVSATGHAALSTGTYASVHGIVNNAWLTPQGTTIAADDDTPDRAAVLSPTGVYTYGKSSANILVETLSDHAARYNPMHIFSISLKSRAAICLAGKRGTAFWFDTASDQFTSSRAYLNQLPAWVTTYNQEMQLNAMTQISWDPCYPLTSPAYARANPLSYAFAQRPPLIDRTTTINTSNKTHDNALEANPLGNQICFDLAARCVETHMTKKNAESMLLWIGISSLDVIGHTYGPDCLETIDMVYHLDKQLQTFMRRVTSVVGSANVLFVLTADHGIEPLPEIAAREGIPAHRLFFKKWIAELNAFFGKKLSLNAPLLHANSYAPYLYFNQQVFNGLSMAHQKRIIHVIKQYLTSKPGVTMVWHRSELEQLAVNQHSIPAFFKNQLFNGRSGDIIIQSEPYCLLTNHTTGADHITPYDLNTHVPLILYQQGVYQKKTIDTPVWTLQVANTLAHLLGLPPLTTSAMPLLPGI